MSTYAYRKPDKSDEISAEDLYGEPSGQTYYCPDPGCSAQLTSVMRHGIKAPYFRALPSHPHREGCPFSKNTASPKERYDERRFNFHCILSGFMSIDESSSSNVSHMVSRSSTKTDPDLEPREPGAPRTIRQTYDLLKQLPSSTYYGCARVADMLFDDRSSRMYTRFVSGDKLIECRLCRKFYDREREEFYLESLPESNRYRLVLSCRNPNIFGQIRSFLYNHRNHSFVVAGNWSPAQGASRRTIRSPVFSKKQICPLSGTCASR